MAKGCTRVRSKNDTGRRLAVRTAMEHPIGTLPRTPFPASRDFPSRGNERYGEEKQRVIYFMYHFAVFPFSGERSEPIRRMLNMLYDIESQSRNADFISIAQRAIRNPRPERPSNLRTFRPSGRSILRTLTPKVCPRAIHNPRPEGPSNLRTLRPQAGQS